MEPLMVCSKKQSKKWCQEEINKETKFESTWEGIQQKFLAKKILMN